MSLLTSVNLDSPGVPQFIEATYTSGGAPMIATAAPAGIVRIAPATTGGSAGGAFLRGGTGATGLVLGANDAVNSQIVLATTPSAAVYLNSNTNVSVPGTALTVTNSITATAGAPGAAALDTFVNRDIHGYSDTGYVLSFSAPQGSGPIPNPVPLPEGLYSVIASAPGDPNIGAQVSATCYWTGTQWIGSGVSTTFTAGSPNAAILPVAGSAQLSLGGVSVPVNTVVAFRQLLAQA